MSEVGGLVCGTQPISQLNLAGLDRAGGARFDVSALVGLLNLFDLNRLWRYRQVVHLCRYHFELVLELLDDLHKLAFTQPHLTEAALVVQSHLLQPPLLSVLLSHQILYFLVVQPQLLVLGLQLVTKN